MVHIEFGDGTVFIGKELIHKWLPVVKGYYRQSLCGRAIQDPRTRLRNPLSDWSKVNCPKCLAKKD